MSSVARDGRIRPYSPGRIALALFSVVRRAGLSAGRARRALIPALSLATLLSPFVLPTPGLAPLWAQDLVGCQLVEGTLQCVPGVTADPQQQIRILEGTIATDQKLEGAIEQDIAGVQRLVLQGQAAEGQLLKAVITADGVTALPPSAFHWYRRTPQDSRWLLIAGASGPSYQLQAADANALVMVVVAVPTAGGSQRSTSAPVGPVIRMSAP